MAAMIYEILLLGILLRLDSSKAQECNLSAAQACLDTIYTSTTPCTVPVLGATHSCLTTNLMNCDASQNAEISRNWTTVYQRCNDPCGMYKDPCGPRGMCETRNNDTWEITCVCDSGWTGSTCDSDLDECTEGLDDCPPDAQCRNKRGSFYCTCGQRQVYDSSSRTCKTYNLCENNALGCTQTCSSTTGCGCHPGYTLNADGRTCSGTGVCSAAKQMECRFTKGCKIEKIGGSNIERCFCHIGSSLTLHGTNCLPPSNQCLYSQTCGPNGCEHNAETGGYECVCPPGQRLQEDKITCTVCTDEWYGDNCRAYCSVCLASSSKFVLCGPEGCTGCKTGFTGPNCDIDVNLVGCTVGTDCGVQGTCVDSPGVGYRCHCQTGHINKNGLDWGTCVEFDECINSFDNDCEELCVNTDIGYDCACLPGHSLNPDGRTCLDINHCVTNDCSQVCVDGELDFTCACNSGYELDTDGKTCNDIDDCADNVCEYQCVDKVGSFACICPVGFKLNTDGKTCSEEIDCDVNNGGCEQLCKETVGLFTCSCSNGFTLNNDGKTCSEEIECDANNGGCEQVCMDTVGSFTCSCNNGFTLNNDGKTCSEEIECDANNGGCEQVCTDTVGSFSCSCNNGFTLNNDGKTCSEEIECDANNGGCEQVCTDTVGSFSCSCNNGFTLNNDGKTCSEESGCDVNNGGCEQVCMVTVGSFTCSCNNGFKLNNDGKTCSEEIECDVNNGGCEQVCMDTVGSFTCSCNNGFILNNDGKTCSEVIECDLNNGGCEQVCMDTVGSFSCSCNNGFTLNDDGKTCSEVDPCEGINHGCEFRCVKETETDYKCTCANGYVLSTSDQKSCADLDECEDQSDDCEQMCENTEGGYTCSCNTGYKLLSDQRSCLKQTDCELGAHGCVHTCVPLNTGGFVCSCNVGFLLDADGKNCDDTDECVGTNKCSQKCVNNDGSYTCECNIGYETVDEGVTCTDVNECTKGTSGCGGGCDNTEGSFVCTCPSGSVLDSDDKTCVDAETCTDLNCAHDCDMTDSGPVCSCSSGYMVSGTDCNDINECEGDHGCGDGCENTVGSYTCTCSGDRVLSNDDKTCIESCVDDSLVCGTSASCKRVDGEDTCVCDFMGYAYINNSCQDIDECLDDDICIDPAECINQVGAYRCECPTGYEFKPNNMAECQDINECIDTDFCVDSTVCINKVPGVFCPCDSSVKSDTSIVIQCFVMSDEEAANIILTSLETNLKENTILIEILGDDLNIIACKYTDTAQGPARRLLQTDRELTFSVLAPKVMTDSERAKAVFIITQQLDNNNLTLPGDKYAVLSNSALLNNGRRVTIVDECSYLNSVNYCNSGLTCVYRDHTTECIEVKGEPVLNRTAVIAITACAGIASIIILMFLFFAIYICYKQKQTNDYYRKEKKTPRSFHSPHSFNNIRRTSRTPSYQPRSMAHMSIAPSSPAVFNAQPVVVGVDNVNPGDSKGIRINYKFYQDQGTPKGSARAPFAPALHSGTARGWSNGGSRGSQGSQGWAPSVGRLQTHGQQQQHGGSGSRSALMAPTMETLPERDTSLHDVPLQQFGGGSTASDGHYATTIEATAGGDHVTAMDDGTADALLDNL